jgi:hypothetical protein
VGGFKLFAGGRVSSKYRGSIHNHGFFQASVGLSTITIPQSLRLGGWVASKYLLECRVSSKYWWVCPPSRVSWFRQSIWFGVECGLKVWWGSCLPSRRTSEHIVEWNGFKVSYQSACALVCDPFSSSVVYMYASLLSQLQVLRKRTCRAAPTSRCDKMSSPTCSM